MQISFNLYYHSSSWCTRSDATALVPNYIVKEKILTPKTKKMMPSIKLADISFGNARRAVLGQLKFWGYSSLGLDI